jgi:hypothetical protein
VGAVPANSVARAKISMRLAPIFHRFEQKSSEAF